MESHPAPASVLLPSPPTLPTGGAARRRLPELLAPAGDWECARAAVENGADAIYFGLDRFNARMRARNFTEADLPPLMEFLHRRGVRGYVTFNTLVFEDEMADAERFLRGLIAAGVDAAIVQDVGLCRLIRRLSTDFPIHASTQMTITSPAGHELARELGCSLVVLARECSLREIEQIQMAAAREDGPPPMPLEVFVHGALCVAYSGQCLTSEALGGRSANRGECAQACRMPYELLADGRKVDLGDRRYLLSPQDLASVELLPELARLGVASLKIEGRLKSPEYVANITRIYRRALDRLAGLSPDAGFAGFVADPARAIPGAEEMGRGGTPPCRVHGNDASALAANPDARRTTYEMEMAFSRGLFTGWFGGTDNQALVHGRFGKKRGVFLGEVTRVDCERERVALRLVGPLKPGDGVVFDAGNPEVEEEGGRVYSVSGAAPPAERGHPGPQQRPRPGAPPAAEGIRAPTCREKSSVGVWLAFGRGDVDFRRLRVGDKVWKTSDPELDRRLRQTFEGNRPRFQRPVAFEVHGAAGRPLMLLARDELGHVARVDSAMPLAPADKQPLTEARLRDQLGRLGGTPFQLGALRVELEGAVLLPVSELNRLRREAVAELERQRARPRRWRLLAPASQATPFGMAVGGNDEGVGADGVAPCDRPTQPRPAAPAPPADAAQLIVLVRSLPQLEAALRSGTRTVYCDFDDSKKYREAVTMFRDWQLAAQGCGEPPPAAPPPAPAEIWVAPPRVFKTGEEWTLRQVRACDADGYLVRNYDHLRFFAEDRRLGDYSLNVANRLAAEFFLERFGLERVTASYDLNFQQLEALLRAAPPAWFEITLHQHMPLFHMEHCVFCAFLTTGHDYRDCGRPCDRHDVRLRDRVGAQHPVKADVGCRNTVFNALAQTGAEYAARLLALGARRFRLEFLNETPAEVTTTIAKYRQLLRGEITGTRVWRDLKLFNQLGVTRGPMAGRET